MYSTERANANELGGTIETSKRMLTNDRSSKFFGSSTVQFMLVKILNSSATRQS